MGRLFDGVAALLGLGARASFEGEVAMRLQFAAEATLEAAAPLPFTLEAPAGAALLRWDEALRELLSELARGSSPGALAARFHAGLIEGILRVAEREQLPVVLGGGCFQNRLLLEGAVARLGARGFEVHWPQAVPPNDGGLAFGQLLGAARTLGGE